jgi:hypothetical protein
VDADGAGSGVAVAQDVRDGFAEDGGQHGFDWRGERVVVQFDANVDIRRGQHGLGRVGGVRQ